MTTRINNDTIERLKKVKKYLTYKNEKDEFYSYDRIVNILLDEYLKDQGISEEYTEKAIKDDEEILKYLKVDTHITRSVRQDINLITEFFQKQKTEPSKKMTVPEFIETAVRVYLFNNPDIQEYVNNEKKNMVQKIAIYKRKYGY